MATVFPRVNRDCKHFDLCLRKTIFRIVLKETKILGSWLMAKLFSSESVCAGHPDKIADQISDAILDALLAQDPFVKSGIEVALGNNCIALFGEVSTTARIDFKSIARATVARLGYTNPAWGFSHLSPVTVHIHQQSPEIALGIGDDEGAGDQGMMFGYACLETPELMPLPIVLAHALARQLDFVRENKTLPFVRPDGKSQVTVAYEEGKNPWVETVVMAVAHSEEIDHKILTQEVIPAVIAPVMQAYGLAMPSTIIINGTGLWYIPGPKTDAGLTGRKIIVDSYGGYARVGGGAFSGKDPSKVDRSGAYGARYIAKNIVAAGLASRCEVALAYVIGRARPVMTQIETFGTHTAPDAEIQAFSDGLLDTSVKSIIQTLDLRRPIYQNSAVYGHFGRSEFSWETIKSQQPILINVEQETF